MKTEKDDRVFGFFKKICNDTIFKNNYRDDITIDELKELLEDNQENLIIGSQKVFERIFQKSLEEKELALNINSIRGLINEAVKKRYLYRWGEENRFLVTYEFLEYIKSLKNPYIKFDIIKHEIEDIEKKAIKCPYCTKINELPDEHGFFEISCKSCSKDFRIVTGIIRTVEEKQLEKDKKTTQIRFFVNDNEEILYFHSDSHYHVERNDKISFVYVKGWLYEEFSKSPNMIANWSSGQTYKI